MCLIKLKTKKLFITLNNFIYLNWKNVTNIINLKLKSVLKLYVLFRKKYFEFDILLISNNIFTWRFWNGHWIVFIMLQFVVS